MAVGGGILAVIWGNGDDGNEIRMVDAEPRRGAVALDGNTTIDLLRDEHYRRREENQQRAADRRLPELPSGLAPEPEAVLSEPASDVPQSTPSPTATPTAPVAGTLTVHLTFYVCAGAPPGQSYCGTMASGNTVYEGAAACGYALSLGTRFQIAGDPTGRTYTCEDRGAGPYWWVDVFWYDYANGRPWRNQFGQDVEIVRE